MRNALILIHLVAILAFGQYAVAQDAIPKPTPTPDTSSTVDLVRRRFAPTVGTGGSVGGPTGLFTIYDGKTLQKRDFTFTIAYSNFDRDPGNVDISVVPLSFNFGLSDHVELFFNTEARRGIKVNSPQNLSSFDLPNSPLLSGGLIGGRPAMVLAPLNNRGITGTLFRPANNQPAVPFPFVGQPSGNFGITGLPVFSGTLAVQGVSGGANTFPGIGSTLGSILPGVVFSTITLDGVTTPFAFSAAPSYLPDAPFMSKTYGTSTFNSFTVGTKIRFSPRSALTNYGVVAFYRSYPDKANSQTGFSMLQRGAGPGANHGDGGVIGFLSHRFGNAATISGNFGYIFDGNPTSSIFGIPKAVLLDRPNELVYGLGVDFLLKDPLSSVVQPIVEVRGTKYVGSQTLNVLRNGPVDLIAGVRLYLPLESKKDAKGFGIFDNLGLGVAYRMHLNQQHSNGGINPVGSVAPSRDSNGFILQLWFGRDRYVVMPSSTDTEDLITLQSGNERITEMILPCPADFQPKSGICPDPDRRPTATATFKAQRGAKLEKGGLAPITWEAPPGTRVIPIVGEKVIWDLSGITKKGFYQLKATSNYKGRKPKTITFTLPVKECDCEPKPSPTPSCPTSIEVTTTSSTVVEGSPATFNAVVRDLPSDATVTYKWTVSKGRIVGSDDTTSLVVDTSDLGTQTVTATVILNGLDSSCRSTAKGDVTTAHKDIEIQPLPAVCKLFDRYGPIAYNDEKARLDNFAIFLNQEPRSIGFIASFAGGTLGRNIGTRKQQTVGTVSAEYRIERAIKYLTEDRGLDPQRISTRTAAAMISEVDLYVCPSNSKEPELAPSAEIQSERPSVVKPEPRVRKPRHKTGKGRRAKRH